MNSSDIPLLRKLLTSSPEPIQRAGLQPSVDHLEEFCQNLSYSLTRILVSMGSINKIGV